MLRAHGAAEAYVGSATVGVSSSLDVHAGSSLGVSTGVLSVSVEGGGGRGGGVGALSVRIGRA